MLLGDLVGDLPRRLVMLNVPAQHHVELVGDDLGRVGVRHGAGEGHGAGQDGRRQP